MDENEELRRIIFDSGAGQTLLKHYESVTSGKKEAIDCTVMSLIPCVMSIISAGYRKSAQGQGMDASAMYDIIRSMEWFRQSRIATHNDIMNTANNIEKIQNLHKEGRLQQDKEKT